MRSILLAGALLLLLAATAAAQVPRTINFQGRVRDAAGVYLDGARQCTLRIYDQPTGGTPLFTEIYNADFDKGTFTIVIGGQTPGGIPEEIEFNTQYWLGCTINGFNNGNEILPRMRMSASPYSMRSNHADLAAYAGEAGYAESAGSLSVPSTISGTTTGDDAVLEVINDDGLVGLRARGNGYAIISEGIDSTSRYFISGESADRKTPSPGGYYRDNAPIAWALVAADGSVLGGFGIASVAHNTTGNYTITLSNPAQIDVDSKQPKLAPMIQPTGLSGPANVTSNWYFRASNGVNIFVQMRNGQGLGEDEAFSIIVFGRPE
jgi:hypothetical protein